MIRKSPEKKSREETIKDRQDKEKQALLEVLKEMPVVQVACKRAGIGRATYYRWRNENREFKKEVDEAIGEGILFINDMSESQIITLIKEKKLPAITLWLRHNHPRYGSKDRLHRPRVIPGELSPEEERIALKALALASGRRIPKDKDGKNRPSNTRKSQRKQED